MCRRQVSAVGDSRPLASCDTGRDRSATGDKVQNAPASGGKTKQFQAFGCRIRCAIDKEAEMRKYIADERSKRTKWTARQWRVNMNAIAAERRWGLGQRGGNRKFDVVAEPAAGGDGLADKVRKPDGKRKRSLAHWRAALP